jgi:glutaredoxin
MRLQILLLASSLAVFCHSSFAVSVFQCEDDRGNISFQDRCPPGTKQLNQKDYKAGPVAGSANKAAAPLTLYTIPGCDTCDQLKEFLSVRQIAVTEKNIADDVALQNELKEKAGELQVPVLMIGDKVLTGYNRASLIQALTESGHITAENP